jgi:hypothetical protein
MGVLVMNPWVSVTLAALLAPAAASPQSGDYAEPMKTVAARFAGREGVVLHVGDSMTYSNNYGRWARLGAGKTARDRAVCEWMHAGADNDTDGWFLCRVDRPGYRSDTAAGGLRVDQCLAGGKGGLPSLSQMLGTYKPRMVVVMLGNYDAWADRKVSDYKADMAKALDLILAQGAIPILSTLMPSHDHEDLLKSYNAALLELGHEKHLPVIDLWGEVLKRRPDDWHGTLVDKPGHHLTASQGGATSSSEPTEENLKSSGYLLRGWLSVQKIAEVKELVLDGRK